MSQPPPQPWQTSAAKLAGLLRMRDGLTELIGQHEAQAKKLRAAGARSQAEKHEKYAERLRALLPDDK